MKKIIRLLAVFVTFNAVIFGAWLVLEWGYHAPEPWGFIVWMNYGIAGLAVICCSLYQAFRDDR